jgi:hypothetical protein
MQNLFVLQKVFAAAVYLFEASSPPNFVLGRVSNFVGYESAHIQSVKVLQNMVSDKTQQSPFPATHWGEC